ncbi:acyl-CoA dehydrogenase family protein [Tahibacter amnicola]|uniref:Acyl-CoA dehydrogenase family protein n=1 Tax=Tahibacter amnicola TaxID=2976241 RepID=A0ABY6BBN2_9GAMM|nr:acyl-CoA dehydrogenase family protein [Tahibacter amnicola]UXI67463.1 acyl-CoA dehydrogenase family protein [Tahibacter amnicola]
MSFVQPAAELGNQYRDDRVLRSYLKRTLAADSLRMIEQDLHWLGEHAAVAWQRELRRSRSEPVHTPWDPTGTRVDRIELTPAWQESRTIAAERGLVAAAYGSPLGDQGRVHQFAMVYLHHVASAIFTCPLAMTDGAATCLTASGNKRLIERALPHYLSRDPATFWISGQWMTETTGGSDVSATETLARADEHGRWRLYGRKWFTSAVHADTALALARPEGAGPGADALALFYLEPRRPDGLWRDIEIHRLKPKLGTRELPSAETQLKGAPAEPVGDLAHGVRSIAPMLNITRCWNAVCAIATMRRGIALARDYANRRVVFGRPLAEQPLHQETLANLQAEFEAAFHLVFYTAERLGQVQAGTAAPAQVPLLRLLTPLVKLWTGKLAVAISSEVLECFGGAGYIEDTGLPALLRDAQVLPIWEGTTNVLSLDTLRALRGGAALDAWQEAQQALLAEAEASPGLAAAVRAVRDDSQWLLQWLQSHAPDSPGLESGARELALGLARCLAASALLRHAAWSLRVEGDPRAAAAARRFVAGGLVRLVEKHGDDARILAHDVA